MNISLPDSMKDFLDAQVQTRGYSTTSEYVRDLIRNDQIRQAELRLASLMLEGLESGPAMTVDEAYWNNKRNALKQRHQAQ